MPERIALFIQILFLFLFGSLLFDSHLDHLVEVLRKVDDSFPFIIVSGFDLVEERLEVILNLVLQLVKVLKLL